VNYGAIQQTKLPKGLPDPAEEDQIFWDADIAESVVSVRDHPRLSARKVSTIDRAIDQVIAGSGRGNHQAIIDFVNGDRSAEVVSTAMSVCPTGVALTVGPHEFLQLLRHHPQPEANQYERRLIEVRTIYQNLVSPDYERCVQYAKSELTNLIAPATLAFLFPSQGFVPDVSVDDPTFLWPQMPTWTIPDKSKVTSLDNDVPWEWVDERPRVLASVVHSFGFDASRWISSFWGWPIAKDLLSRLGSDQALSTLLGHGCRSTVLPETQSAVLCGLTRQPHRGVRLLSGKRFAQKPGTGRYLRQIHQLHPGILQFHLPGASPEGRETLLKVIDGNRRIFALSTETVSPRATEAPATKIAWLEGEQAKAIILNNPGSWGSTYDGVRWTAICAEDGMDACIESGYASPFEVNKFDESRRNEALSVAFTRSRQSGVCLAKVLAENGPAAIAYVERAIRSSPRLVSYVSALASVDVALATLGSNIDDEVAIAWMTRHPNHASVALVQLCGQRPSKRREAAERRLQQFRSLGFGTAIQAALTTVLNTMPNGVRERLEQVLLAADPPVGEPTSDELFGLVKLQPRQTVRRVSTRVNPEIVRQLGKTADEVVVLAVPTCGLGPNSSIVDFGSRTFRLSLNKHLQPITIDEYGTARETIPKPRIADDPALVQLANSEWKKHRSNAKDAVAFVVNTFDLAIGQRYRWSQTVFTQMINHPVFHHLMEPMIWSEWNKAGELCGTFRIAEDRSFSNGDDESHQLGTGSSIGIAHPLDLDREGHRKWTELVGLYNQIQFVPQLGRTAFQANRKQIDSWTFDFQITRHRIKRMFHRGWENLDGVPNVGTTRLFKDIGSGRLAQVFFQNGESSLTFLDITADKPREIPFTEVHPVELSEAVYDIELCRPPHR
jgi:Domain of unknown function (DUF4132)